MIRFCGSLLPSLAKPRFVKVAIAGEENEPIQSDGTPDFMKASDDSSMLTDVIIAKAQRIYKLLYPGPKNLSEETAYDVLDHVISHLHNQAGHQDEDEIMLVMEYLSEELEDGVAIFQYPNLKPIVEKALMQG